MLRLIGQAVIVMTAMTVEEEDDEMTAMIMAEVSDKTDPLCVQTTN